jgi:hypothetical protein
VSVGECLFIAHEPCYIQLGNGFVYWPASTVTRMEHHVHLLVAM